MKTIRISTVVWQAIEKEGKFGETPDDVLRRLIGLKPGRGVGAYKRRRSTKRMRAFVEGRQLHVSLGEDPGKTWQLPSLDKKDNQRIRQVRSDAIAFIRANGGTSGQEAMLYKRMAKAGYTTRD